MESAQEETHAASATMRVNVECQRGGPLLLEKRRRKAKKTVRREDHSPASVRSGRDIEDRAKITWMEIARTPRVILGILPCVRITDLYRAACSMKCDHFCTRRLIVSRTKDRSRVVKRVLSVAVIKNAKPLGCVFQDNPQKKSIVWEVGKLESNRTVKFSKTTMRHA